MIDQKAVAAGEIATALLFAEGAGRPSGMRCPKELSVSQAARQAQAAQQAQAWQPALLPWLLGLLTHKRLRHRPGVLRSR